MQVLVPENKSWFQETSLGSGKRKAALRYIAVTPIDGRKFRPRPYNAIDYVHKTTRLRLLRGFRFVIAILTCLGVAPALAEMKPLTHDTRFCPSWAEAHERTLASLNNGRPAYPVKWKGCIMLKRGTPVDVVDQQEESTEIVVRGKHWFTDE